MFPKPEKFLSDWKWFGSVVVAVVIGTATLVHWLEAKQLELKEQENAVLRARLEAGDVTTVSERLNDIERQIAPLLEAAKVDPLSGRVDFGSMSTGTLMTTKLQEAEEHLNNKRYDKALDLCDQMATSRSGFMGHEYMRFRVYRDRGFEREALSTALKLIEALPADSRLGGVYEFAVNALLSKGEKARAEDLARKALGLWPTDENLRASFGTTFGYVPN